MYIISIIYGAHWKSHECPSRDLSISALERYLCDENRLAPTIVWSLHAFLTLAHKSPSSSAPYDQQLYVLYETPGCTYRLSTRRPEFCEGLKLFVPDSNFFFLILNRILLQRNELEQIQYVVHCIWFFFVGIHCFIDLLNRTFVSYIFEILTSLLT